ncbi:MAG TPA: hypothetical protein VL463_25150 [Kofleriaceae bacterium]|nr:hypothetical protein [Kofleriaceae bacterium]
MAKDSTAVQKLIELAQQKPIDIDLGGLFESEPPKKAALPPPRATAPMAAMQPNAAPPPLPRTRPSGTQQAIPAIPAGTPMPERIDPSAADDLFGGKPLPPLPVAGPAQPPPVAALPPRRSAQVPVPQAQPLRMPPPHVADELPTSPVSLADMAEMENGDWFQKSEAIDRFAPDDELFGTESVGRRRGSAVVAIAAAFGLGLVAAGGYLVYNKMSADDAKATAAPGSPAANIAAAAGGAKVRPAPTPSAAPAAAVSPSIAAVEQVSPPAAAPQPTVTPIDQAAPPAPAPAAEAVAAVAPAPAPAPAPAAAGPVVGSLIDVTLKSEPEGVTVMLIDGGGAVKLGKTPTVASLSAGTQHQILFSRDGYSATIATIDPASQTDMMVALVPTPGTASTTAQVAAVAPAPTPAPAVEEVAPAPAPAPKAKAEPKHAKTEPKHVEKTVAKTETPAPKEKTSAPKRTAVASGGTGTLMIGAKPPCDIIIDGRTTGLTTPQRAITLPPGSHSITLVNRANNIKKSFSVSINAGSPTKVVKDFTSLIKK